ncbi:MAG: hypothetical protein FK734_17845 [Asgard group archaeon]|nr:hypothetical protein [Asgard group archaeon]
MEKTGRNVLQAGILLGFIGTVVVNTLSAIGLINNKTPQELSDALDNYFVPSGITFTVWTLIYIALLGLTIYSILSWFKKDMNPPEFLDKMGIEFILAAVANIAWIFLWHYQTELGSTAYSLGAMLILLGALLSAYIRLRIGKNQEAKAAEKWLIHLPFSFYLGWITIATVANVTALLVETGWQDIIAPTDQWKIIFTAIIMTIATILTFLMLIIRNDIGYSLIVIWALVGIILKRYEVFVDGGTLQLGIMLVAGEAIVLILVLIGVSIVKLAKGRKEANAYSM